MDKASLSKDNMETALAITPGEDSSKVLSILDKVKNLRGLGLQLDFPTADLNALDECSDYKERRVNFLLRWSKQTNCDWISLVEALRAPQFDHPRLVEEIVEEILKPRKVPWHASKQDSVDSALGTPSPNSAPNYFLLQGKSF